MYLCNIIDVSNEAQKEREENNMEYVERKISVEDLISFDEIAKKHIAG